MKDFRDLKVWEKSHRLAVEIYRQTQLFPRNELYGLTSQLRRAAVSVPTNIAEGCGRGSDDDFARFLQIAMGSACEVEYLLLLSHDLRYVDPGAYSRFADGIVEVKRMLVALLYSVRPPADR